MENEEKTEIVSLWVDKKTKLNLEAAKDNKSLQEEIAKRFVKTELDWMEGEMKFIDEATIIYKSKLIAIRENFGKAQDLYVEEIAKIYTKANNTFKKLDKISEGVSLNIESAFAKIEALNKKIEYINPSNLERLLNTIDRYNSMTGKEKELIKLLIK